MTFLTKAQTAKANIAALAVRCHGEYQAAASNLNAMIGEVLALTDADLAEFANDIGPEMVGQITTWHAMHGAAITELSATATAMLEQCGLSAAASAVDTRPLEEKLAAQFRALEFDQATGLFSVARLPEPEPQPEPTPEP